MLALVAIACVFDSREMGALLVAKARLLLSALFSHRGVFSLHRLAGHGSRLRGDSSSSSSTWGSRSPDLRVAYSRDGHMRNALSRQIAMDVSSILNV